MIFEPIHRDVEFVEILVSKKLVVDEVELPPSVRKGVTVAFSRKIHPSVLTQFILRAVGSASDSLGMSEFITFEVQICFATEGVHNETTMFRLK